MAGKSPQGQLTEMNPVKVKAIIHSLRELYVMYSTTYQQNYFISLVKWGGLRQGTAGDYRNGEKFH